MHPPMVEYRQSFVSRADGPFSKVAVLFGDALVIGRIGRKLAVCIMILQTLDGVIRIIVI